jgi:hypothetical protein
VTPRPDSSRPDRHPVGIDRVDGVDGVDAEAVTTDPDDAAIDEVGEESFPASDSPSSWSGPPSES